MSTDTIRYELRDAIAYLVLDDPRQSANTMNEDFGPSLEKVVSFLEEDVKAGRVKGAVVASAKKTFIAGGDLNELVVATTADAEKFFERSERVKGAMRRLEKVGVPVVSAINGAALGGGLELALATHHRIAADGRFDVGLPEVSLGLLPGGGGVTRVVRMLGLQIALPKVLMSGARLKPAKALELGLIDEVVPAGTLLDAAVAWVEAHADDPEASVQPWDKPGFTIPGGSPASGKLAAILPSFSANLRKQVKGAPIKAPRNILCAAVEGALVDFDTASRIETRYFVDLVVGQQSSNMTRAFFFDLGSINAGGSRPAGIEHTKVSKVAVVGAGMMGAGIAYVAAKAGLEVVLKDIDLSAAEKGKAYSEKIVAKQVSRGHVTQDSADALLARITPTDAYANLAGSDFVVEAVFESVALKQGVFAEIEKVVLPDALLGSNTSTLPITLLAEGVSRPKDFIGIHFFSPVDKMPLVEIVVGEETSDEAIARVIDFVLLIRKTPIVVNDSRGFFTSRVINTFINEGVSMLTEGVEPWTIERATTQAGFPAPVLQLTDELNMELLQKVRLETQASVEADGGTWEPHPAQAVVDAMIEAGRPGRLHGAGFYDYADGARGEVWAGLSDLYPIAQQQLPLTDLRDRLTFIMSLEAIKCVEEDVLRTVADANIGSIFGIGFPAHLGGVLQAVNGYESPEGEIGVAAFAGRAQELADVYGSRFAPPQLLIDKAKNGEKFA